MNYIFFQSYLYIKICVEGGGGGGEEERKSFDLNG